MVASQYRPHVAGVNGGWRPSGASAHIVDVVRAACERLPRSMHVLRGKRATALIPTLPHDLRHAVNAAQAALGEWVRERIAAAEKREDDGEHRGRRTAKRSGKQSQKRCLPPMLLTRLPSGTGKTHMIARAIARLIPEIRRTGRPVVYAVESYVRMGEMEAVFASIAAEGLYEAMGVPPLTTERWTGQARGGCLREVADSLNEMGASASPLCEGRDRKGNTVTCPFSAACPLKAVRSRFLDEKAPVDLVFVAHRFLRGRKEQMPTCIQDPLFVVIDERALAQLVGIETLDRAVLHRARSRRPEHADAEAVRSRAVDAVDRALGCGDDPAAALVRAMGGAEQAVKTCVVLRSLCRPRVAFGPASSDEQVLAAARRAAAAQAAQERQLWALLAERVAALAAGDARHESLSIEVDEGGRISLAWRESYTWSHVPAVVLDATAEPAEYRRHFGGTHHIRTLDSDRPLIANQALIWIHVPGLTKTALVPMADATAEERAKAVEMERLLTDVMATIEHLHAPNRTDGQRLLAIAPKAVCAGVLERALDGDRWARLWYGGQRGCDSHRDTAAVALIGRPELPQETYRAYARAWTHDLPADEAPRPRNEFPVRTEKRTLPMRDGSRLRYLAPVLADEWQALCQAQHREGELTQGLGRTRAIRRDDTPVAYIIGDIVPYDVVLDVVVRVEEFLTLKPGAVPGDLTGRVDAVAHPDSSSATDVPAIRCASVNHVATQAASAPTRAEAPNKRVGGFGNGSSPRAAVHCDAPVLRPDPGGVVVTLVRRTAHGVEE